MLDPCICQSFCLPSYDCLTVKAGKASINVSDASYKSCTLLWYTKKRKLLAWNVYFTFTKYWYTAVQTDLKYLLHEIPTIERDWSSVKAYIVSHLFGFWTAMNILSSPLEISIKFLRNMVIFSISTGGVLLIPIGTNWHCMGSNLKFVW